jgi:hypothetical protein
MFHYSKLVLNTLLLPQDLLSQFHLGGGGGGHSTIYGDSSILLLSCKGLLTVVLTNTSNTKRVISEHMSISEIQNLLIYYYILLLKM